MCSGGDLNPILWFCFPLFSIALPRETAIGVENSGREWKQNCCKLLQVYVQVLVLLCVRVPFDDLGNRSTERKSLKSENDSKAKLSAISGKANG
jgi:hypothetical protein